MKVSMDDVIDMISNNDAQHITELLEETGFFEKYTPLPFTSAGKKLASVILSYASVMTYNDGQLDNDLALELIERISCRVDIFLFLKLVTFAAKIKNEDTDIIPTKIIHAMCRDNYSDKIAYAIEKMDKKQFHALIAALAAGEIESLHIKFSLPIIKYIYVNDLIPKHLTFAYMGLSLRDTVTDQMTSILDNINGIIL